MLEKLYFLYLYISIYWSIGAYTRFFELLWKFADPNISLSMQKLNDQNVQKFNFFSLLDCLKYYNIKITECEISNRVWKI